MIYQSFAQLYDELFDAQLYEQWRDYTLNRLPSTSKTVLDLAGGAGRLACLLATAGLDLTVAGFYPEMLSLADSLCYLDDLANVQETFSQVSAHLAAGGRFLFDMISPYQTDVVYPGYMYNYEDEDQQRAFIWRSFADDDVKHGVIHELAFFNQLPDGNYHRVGETHFERSYPLEELQAALQQAGFQRVKVTADFGRQEVTPETTRWFFECQK